MLAPFRNGALARRTGSFKGCEAGKDGANGVANRGTDRFAVRVEACDGIGVLGLNVKDVRPTGVVAHQGPWPFHPLAHPISPSSSSCSNPPRGGLTVKLARAAAGSNVALVDLGYRLQRLLWKSLGHWFDPLIHE
jgi:hypothetical protein